MVDKNIDAILALMDRAKKAGYNGILLSDYKFNVLDRVQRELLPQRPARHGRRRRSSASTSSRASSPSDTPRASSRTTRTSPRACPSSMRRSSCKGGKLVPVMDPETKLVNGSFEDLDAKGRFTGWWQENVGRSVFADRDVVKDGKLSLRMQDIRANSPEHGHCRVQQLVKAKPFRNYQLSVWVKTQDFDTPDAVKILVLAKSPQTLSYQDLARQAHAGLDACGTSSFNSLENDEVRVYLGVWGGKTGKLWWDDLRWSPPGSSTSSAARRARSSWSSPNGMTGRSYEQRARTSRASSTRSSETRRYPGTFAAWHTPPEVDGSRRARA